MGTNACQCLCKKEDNSNVMLNIEEGIAEIEKGSKPDNSVVPFKDTIEKLKKNEAEVIRIQAIYRGHIARKNLVEMKSHNTKNDEPIITVKQTLTTKPQFKELLTFPGYSNEAVNRIEAILGPYEYKDKAYSIPNEQLITKGPVEQDHSAVYIGQWKSSDGDYIRYGRGIQIWPDGAKYEGYWKNNMANGRGRLIHADGDYYIGEWLDDKADGHGEYSHVDGSKYVGQWKNDKQHGYGIEAWPDGSKYQGIYCEGKKHGRGKFIWSDYSIYEGDFLENDIEGQGLYQWTDGRKYEGGWKKNKMEGKGIFSWPDGRKYVGEYLDDKKHGFGDFVWPDGRRYVGQWENGKQNGKGTYTTTEGKVRVGEWNCGKRVRWIESEDKNMEKNDNK